jgi:dihydrodipicolinate synthase/N-acetylneuraminate lyase
MKGGFITALGTPFDKDGILVEESFAKHVDHQVGFGALGLLVMGSMGIEPYIKSSEYGKAAKVAVDTIKGRCPVFVGVMDTSIGRVKDRIDALNGLEIDGVVSTVPYYYAVSQDEAVEFYSSIAAYSKYPVYMYDLGVVTQTKISFETAMKLSKVPGMKGIKTGDVVLARKLIRELGEDSSFEVFFSGLDLFDMAYKYGLKANLDGMFACTLQVSFLPPKNISTCMDERINLCLNPFQPYNC